MMQQISTYHQTVVRFLLLLLLFIGSLEAQVKTSVDTTTIKIGEELILTLEVESDSTSTIIFSEGQTFQPLELLESYAADTTQNDLKIKLIKKFGLTQFDSGSYIIPQQKVLINDKVFFSDSLAVRVNAVMVDTTKQKLYDIKPIIELKKSQSFGSMFWWVLIILTIVACIIYLIIWRKKTHENDLNEVQIAPYEKAKRALEKLDEKHYFENNKIKSFYSELTFVLRQYLNEKVYNQSLESTTDELLEALRTLSNSKKIDLKNETLKKIESTLKRADLVKFAKSQPDFEIIRSDKNIINQEIDAVKEGLPEPTEDELKRSREYLQELKRKKKQKQLKLAVISTMGLLIFTFIGCSIYFGFTPVKDTLLRHPSKLLLETEPWVSSEYGAPGISISSPEVLERVKQDSLSQKDSDISVKAFEFVPDNIPLRIVLKSSKYIAKDDNKQQKKAIDLLEVADKELTTLESLGASNMFPKNEQFITPNGQEGLKTYGRTDFPFDGSNNQSAEFIILGFSTTDLLQQLVIIWAPDDQYVDQITKQIMSSVELIKINEE